MKICYSFERSLNLRVFSDQTFSATANATAYVLRCYFAYEAFVPPIGQVGRCNAGAFGQPKGKTTADGPIPYLRWLKLNMVTLSCFRIGPRSRALNRLLSFSGKPHPLLSRVGVERCVG